MNPNVPLAERIRPISLDELLGQEHLVGKGSILRTAIELLLPEFYRQQCRF